jgi:hypothetical protein
MLRMLVLGCVAATFLPSSSSMAGDYEISEDDAQITVETPHLRATIRKRGYVSGIAGGTFLDKKTGVRDLGFGLDIVDWIMEPGSDERYRDQLDEELIYRFGNLYHGKRPKRSIEGPQICTKAGQLSPEVIRGDDFVAIRMSFRYRTAAPGRKAGSTWTQTIVFPCDQRYFLSCDRVDTVNDSDAMFLRIDMPGHIKHQQGDTFSHIYLSYLRQTGAASPAAGDQIPSSLFTDDFPPDDRFNYRRDRLEVAGQPLPERFIRAYRISDSGSDQDGPWLAGMTLDPTVVHEAWCHQRGYVCMIEEFGGRPIRAGDSFSAAFIVGYFDSIQQMHDTYDDHKGFTGLSVSREGWKLTR